MTQKLIHFYYKIHQGIGNTTSKNILSKLNIDENIRVKELVEQQIVQLRNELQTYVLEGDLRRQVSQNIRRLSEIGSYRGSRHKRKLPSRGQRTHTKAERRIRKEKKQKEKLQKTN